MLRFLLVLLLGLPPAFAGEIQTLNEKLIRLRAEVDRMQADLDRARQQHRATMAGFAAQNGDLQTRKRRLQSEVERLQKEKRALQEQLAQNGMDADQLRPVLLQVMETSRERIRSGLPFKTADRISVLQTIRDRLEQGTLDSWTALQQFWAFLEDEFRLMRENGLHSQTIRLQGEDMLVDVAHLGGVMLFFKTRDGRYGMAQPAGTQPGSWTFLISDDEQEQRQIRTLFDSLQKQIRQGYFTLPARALSKPATQRDPSRSGEPS